MTRAGLAGLALALAFGTTAWAAPDLQDFDLVSRGRLLTVEADCAACHDAPDGRPFAGGRPLRTPFGTMLSANITPDRTTGIGAMTAAQFVDVLQKGRGPGGVHIYPAMPYLYLANTDRKDDLAIYAYLMTVTPVRRRVETDTLPFPFDIRASLAAWNLLYFRKHPFRPDPSQSASWNRGAYLVNGFEHCGACHTPKTILGGDDTAHALQGGRLQGWFAPDLTENQRRGLATWSVSDIVTYLKTGHNRFADASGPMGEEVQHSSSEAPDGELHDIAIYLKSLPASGGGSPTPLDPHAAVMSEGAAIYGQECSACHKPDGTGVVNLFPHLAGGPAVQQRDPTDIIRVVLHGARSVQTHDAPTGPAMPSFGWVLNDADVAAVATYVRNAWGNAAPAVTATDVRRTRAEPAAS